MSRSADPAARPAWFAAVAIACGYYRLVLRFGTPTLVARSALVSGISGLILGAVGWYGGTTLMRALGLGAVFALVLFSEFVLSRACAHFLLTRNGGPRQGTVVAIYGAGAAGQQLVAMLRRTASIHKGTSPFLSTRLLILSVAVAAQAAGTARPTPCGFDPRIQGLTFGQ